MKTTFLSHHYQTLGLQPSATPLEVKNRYRQLSKKFHPDKGGSAEQMAKINEAYSILSDPFRRKMYDAQLRAAAFAAKKAGIVHPPKQDAASSRQSKPASHSRWWPKVAWGFAALVVMVGLLTQLPIAEAISSPNTSNQTANDHIRVDYPPAYTPSSPANNQSANSGSQAPAASSQTTVQQSAPQASDTKDTTSDSPQPVQLDDAGSKNCTTKTYGEFKQEICRNNSGRVCSTTTLGARHYNNCD